MGQFKITLARFSIAMMIMPCASGTQAETFDLSAPQANGASIQLWATTYHVHTATQVPAGPNNIVLMGKGGQSLNVSLSLRDWCDAALEGTVTVVKSNGSRQTYNVGGMSTVKFADCSKRFLNLDPKVVERLGRMEFFKVPEDAPYGLGSSPRYRLVPYRSLAADKSVFPSGTVLFIPGLRGTTITSETGVKATHDGYVMVVDTGGGIRGNHIDFFTGTSVTNPAPTLFQSTDKAPFEAQLVSDPSVIAKLKTAHLRPGYN